MSRPATQAAEPAPLTPAVYAILLALTDGEKHGYAIMQEARQTTPMGPGTLYGSLDRMLANGMVVETGLSEDERRRFYKLTATGTAALSAETARMRHALVLARAKGVRAARGIVA